MVKLWKPERGMLHPGKILAIAMISGYSLSLGA